MVGSNIDKVDAVRIITGKPAYTDDLVMRDALVIKILRSPHAFAKIIDINTAIAEKVDGVECILTYKDVPQTRFALAGQAYPELSPYDRLILDPIVRYVGDEVAIVAAKDEKTAIKAMNLIKVKYEVYEPVLDPEKAIDNSSVIHDEDDIENVERLGKICGFDAKRNIVATVNMATGGDVEEELNNSEVVVDETYSMQAQGHGMMETYRSFSYLDYTGRLVVVSSTQIPFHVRRHVSRALEIPSSKVRVIKPRVGGGFGGKQTAAVEFFPAIVTWKTGKPSKIIYDRKETFGCTNTRHAMKIRVRIGADNEGNIKAIDMEGLSDTGAFGDHGFAVFGASGKKSIPLYKANAARFHGKVVYTNKVPAGAFRGYGATQGDYALESAMNEMAARLNMDPTEFRLKNLCQVGEKMHLLGTPLTSSTLDKCIERGKEIIGWKDKYPRVQVSDTKVRSVGMALGMQGSGIANVDCASVQVRLGDDGFYTIYLAGTDMGQGCDTILTQIAAEKLMTNFDDIVINVTDTDTVPYDGGSYASSTTYVTGMAVVKACDELIEKIYEAGAGYLNVSKDDVDFDGKVLKSTNGEQLTLKDMAVKSVSGVGGRQLQGHGTFGSATSPSPYMVGLAEVEVDKETGKVDMVNYVGIVDCGTLINPKLAKVQVEGGIVQGIGLALYEDVRYNKKGKLDTNTFMQYKMPCRKEIGNIIVDFIPSYEPTGPFGAKSVGEVVINTTAPAISNAIYNAVEVNLRELPMFPEKVFNAMHLNK